MRFCLVSLTLALLAACGSRHAEQPPDVVLIVMDTVRADHLSCYGYERRTTPHLDALAARADRYTRARSTAPWTLPSHASLFTGKFPHEHGVDGREGGSAVAFKLPAEELTLAEALARRGYRTGAFAANVAHVNPRSGLDQGFETFRTGRLPASELSEVALTWLDKADAASARKPVFLFLNYMDAHREYNVAPLAPERARELPPPPPQDVGLLLDRYVAGVLGSAAPPDPELRRLVVDAYDLGLANLDAGLEHLFEGLRRRGRFEQALIVVTSDHGEYFGEHELAEHAKDVYEPVLHVPLIVKRPHAGAGRVLDTPLSLAEIPGLVFDFLPPDPAAASAPFAADSSGRGLLAELAAGAGRRNPSIPFADRFDRDRSVLYQDDWKLIHSSDGAHELYDLASDPMESRNLFRERPDVAGALERRLLALTASRASDDGAAPEPLTEDELRELRELGY